MTDVAMDHISPGDQAYLVNYFEFRVFVSFFIEAISFFYANEFNNFIEIRLIDNHK